MNKSIRRSALILAALSLLLAGAAQAQNSVAVTGAAAMNGTNFGLEVSLDGASTNLAYVQDDTPTDETVYRASFWVNANNLGMALFQRFPIFLGRDDANGNVLRLQLHYNGNNHRLRLQIRKNNGDWVQAREMGDTGPQFLAIGSDTPRDVLIEARYENSNMGFVRLVANGRTFFKEGYQAGNYEIDHIRFGATRNLTAALNGSFYLDEFQSFRTLAP